MNNDGFEASQIRALEMLSNFDVAAEELVEERDTKKLSFRWASFLKQHKLTLSALYHYSMQNKRLKPIGYRAQNYEKSNKVLSYLRAARNADEHADEHSHALVAQRGYDTWEIGQVFSMTATSTLLVGDLLIDGKRYGGFSARGNGKRVDIVQEHGMPKLPVSIVKGGLKLAEKITDIDGRTVLLPKIKNPDGIASYIFLALDAVKFTSTLARELELDWTVE